jgi:hypothetical protein
MINKRLIESIYSKIYKYEPCSEHEIVSQIMNDGKYHELTTSEKELHVFDAAISAMSMLEKDDKLVNYLIFEYKIDKTEQIEKLCEDNPSIVREFKIMEKFKIRESAKILDQILPVNEQPSKKLKL